MSDDIHIVSLIIHVLPEYKNEIMRHAKKMSKAECHSNKEQNKFVLVFEAESDAVLSSSMDEINNWQGVMSTQLCYHHCETNESLQEEIQYANQAS
ncbi:MAG: nitrate reductase [marine bacterium B5-7]|nr:MAG: nitrate reductase [marine bacterium B5-7]